MLIIQSAAGSEKTTLDRERTSEEQGTWTGGGLLTRAKIRRRLSPPASPNLTKAFRFRLYSPHDRPDATLSNKHAAPISIPTSCGSHHSERHLSASRTVPQTIKIRMRKLDSGWGVDWGIISQRKLVRSSTIISSLQPPRSKGTERSYQNRSQRGGRCVTQAPPRT